MLAAVIYLLYLIFSSSVSYYVTVSEFYDREAELGDVNVRVAGKVVESSINWNSDNLELGFTIAEGGNSMPVIFHGAQPSGFKADSSVLVEGRYRPDGVFEAKQLILKCPSKYEEAVE